MYRKLLLAILMLSSSLCAWADAAGAATPHIQILAASCAACHGTNGHSVTGTPVLAGLDQNHFILQMQAFRSGERQSTVMHRHAKGLTLEEINQLAVYFSQQARTSAHAPTSQLLQAPRDD
jgi:cytochrome subunit of sulfide dehydrogenase